MGSTAGDWRGEILEAGPTGTRFRVRVRGRLHGEARVRMPGDALRRERAGRAVRGRLSGRAVRRLAARRWRIPGGRPALLACAARRAACWSSTTTATTPRRSRRPSRRRGCYGRRLVVAFQPHRYTRTRDLLADFAPALAGADELLLTDIYPAGEAPIAGADAACAAGDLPGRRAGAPRPARPADGRRWPARLGRAIWCSASARATSPPYQASCWPLLGAPGEVA